jgi:hypothetical protein
MQFPSNLKQQAVNAFLIRLTVSPPWELQNSPLERAILWCIPYVYNTRKYKQGRREDVSWCKQSAERRELWYRT